MKIKQTTPIISSITAVLACMATNVFAANYTVGHGDIGIAYEDEGSGPEFFLHYHTGVSSNLGEGEHEPADIVTVVGSSTSSTVPTDATFNTMTGTTGGQDMWILPQSNPSPAPIPFLGIATEELSFGAGADQFSGSVTFEMVSLISAPIGGAFSLWQPGALPGQFNFSFSSANEAGTVNGDNTLSFTGAGHDHFNWGFSEPGLYEIQLSVTGTHNTDGVLTDTETFRFNVVPEPSSALLGMIGVLSLLINRRR